MAAQILLVRHGETEWSRTGQHTGQTDIPLTQTGEHDARKLAERLDGYHFIHVLTSPRLRARRTCELVRLGAKAVIDPDLTEWDYGDYEGRRTLDILKERPDWNLFQHGCPHGEAPQQVSDRADRVIHRIRELHGGQKFSAGKPCGRLRQPCLHKARLALTPGCQPREQYRAPS